MDAGTYEHCNVLSNVRNVRTMFGTPRTLCFCSNAWQRIWSYEKKCLAICRVLCVIVIVMIMFFFRKCIKKHLRHILPRINPEAKKQTQNLPIQFPEKANIRTFHVFQSVTDHHTRTLQNITEQYTPWHVWTRSHKTWLDLIGVVY